MSHLVLTRRESLIACRALVASVESRPHRAADAPALRRALARAEGECSLTELLEVLGYQHCPAEHGKHDVVAKSGEVAFTGAADEVWAWLRATKQVQPSAVAICPLGCGCTPVAAYGGWCCASALTDRASLVEGDVTWLEPFCACGRRLSQCDGSRRSCVSKSTTTQSEEVSS
ncbi:hypothetical protein [Myxococcus eversor]|uniref:hypothetical protein n=1 Tax=Myxococcus eversor TaxID=2709661 RepID=UPI0013D02BA2|nr:hypothetical protein [Myxococcus eversor]